MNAWAAAVCSLLLLAGSAADPLASNLRRAQRQGHLPLKFAVTIRGQLELTFHRDADSSMAYYLPALMPRDSGNNRSDTPATAAPSRPRLVLYEPYFRQGDALVAVVDMPLDMVEHYFYALAIAYLDLEILSEDGAPARTLKARAQETMLDVDPEYRLEAYDDALASFASHLLSVANELERKRLAQGEARLCGALVRDQGLFAVWGHAFADGFFAGSYVVESPARGAVRLYSRTALAPEDKRLAVRLILEERWRGNPWRDFARRFCAPDDGDYPWVN